MNLALGFTRILFVILSIFFMTVYAISGQSGYSASNLGIGVLLGASLSILLLGFDYFFRRYNLRSFNIVLVGLFIGYLMGQALVLVLGAILDISSASIHLDPRLLEVLKIALFLFGLYFATLMTLRASDEFYLSIPFVRFAPTAHKRRDLIVDPSVLIDARILDLASSGLLDNHLIIPRFTIKDLYAQAETSDEFNRGRAKRALEVVKKLEHMPELDLRFSDTDFPDAKEQTSKMIRLARLHDANILTADISRVQMASIEGIKVINIHTLANALKPMMQAGESIRIKVQRYGKEPRQGIGYLEDGTMVVINGGGDFIGETIDAQVLSVKHTTSGRMIFCNALDEEGPYPHYDEHEDH